MKHLVVLLILLVVGAAAFVFAAASILSHPVQRHIGIAPADLNARDVMFKSTSGATVHGWLSIVPNSKIVVLLLPGVRANRLVMVDRARFLRRAGSSVMLIDLQGTGETRGERITFGWLESRDVLAAVDLLRKQLPNIRVAVIGQSLGGAAALLATPPLQVDALVVEQVYPTIEQATENRLRKYFGALGKLGKPLLLMQLRPRLGVSPERLRPMDHVAQVRCPILVIGGSKDQHTTPAETRQLFAKANAPKDLWLVEGAAHVDLHRFAGKEYERRILNFLGNSSFILHPSSFQ